MSTLLNWGAIPSDFMDDGALIYAYSNPVILVKISEIPINIYAGT